MVDTLIGNHDKWLLVSAIQVFQYYQTLRLNNFMLVGVIQTINSDFEQFMIVSC